MGGSSKQTIGYQYFSFFLLFIGNPIEKMLGINFDKRGWHTPLIDKMGNPLSVGVIEKATLYGENEGGVAGQIHARYGTENQEVVSFYKEYMESKGLQASAYPYQSYLAFPDFYLGNSGYMKEMLLWPKRIHVRNDGRGQWYDSKAEIPEIYYISSGESYLPLSVSMETICYWTGLGWDYTPIAGEANVGNFTFPMSEKETSYQVEFLGAGELDNGDPMGAIPSSIAAADFIFSKGMPGAGGGTALPPVKWQLNKLPDFDNYGRDSIVRKYKGGGEFYWPGGVFDYRCVTSSNGASIQISKNDKDLINIGSWDTEHDWLYREGKLDLAAGIYEAKFNVGDRYSLYSLPRPLIHFVVKQGNALIVPGGDINPIHKIREILTDDTAMNKPESSVNDANFIKAADQIYAEGLGISWSITEKSCMDAINELCYHIEAGIRVNRQTGLYEMVLFRDDWFEENEIHAIAESKIKSMQYEITNADEVVNQVNVNYYDRANIKNSSFSISESGLIQTLGRVNAETLDFPYFMNMRNAEVVANWKLKQLSTGAFKGSFTTGWREARKWNRYDLLRLPWSKRWTGTILVRIMSINLGGPMDNEVSIDFIEIVPSTGMMNTSIVADEPIEKPLPPQACQYEPFEMPYYLAVMALGQRQVDDELAYESNFGLVGVVAEQPQSNSLYAVMMTNNYDEWVRAGSIQYSETADLDQNISKVSTSFTVKNWKKIANVPVGTLIQCGKEWLTGFVEWMVFQGVDPYTGVVSVKRGALDTQPQEWDLGLKLYFCGTDVAYDETEYVAGEKVLVSALTTTPSGVLELKGSHSVEMKARAIRPYPPANVKINGEYWPTEVEGSFELTWADRNRVQQTGGEIIGWYEEGVTLENGVSYELKVYAVSTSNVETIIFDQNIGAVNTYIIDVDNSTAPSFKIILDSIRDGFKSYQAFEHQIVRPLTAPQNLTAVYNP